MRQGASHRSALESGGSVIRSRIQLEEYLEVELVCVRAGHTNDQPPLCEKSYETCSHVCEKPEEFVCSV